MISWKPHQCRFFLFTIFFNLRQVMDDQRKKMTVWSSMHSYFLEVILCLLFGKAIVFLDIYIYPHTHTRYEALSWVSLKKRESERGRKETQVDSHRLHALLYVLFPWIPFKPISCAAVAFKLTLFVKINNLQLGEPLSQRAKPQKH